MAKRLIKSYRFQSLPLNSMPSLKLMNEDLPSEPPDCIMNPAEKETPIFGQATYFMPADGFMNTRVWPMKSAGLTAHPAAAARKGTYFPALKL